MAGVDIWPRGHEGFVSPEFSSIIKYAEVAARGWPVQGRRTPPWFRHYTGYWLSSAAQSPAVAHISTTEAPAHLGDTQSPRPIDPAQVPVIGEARAQFGKALRSAGGIEVMTSVSGLKAVLDAAERRIPNYGAAGEAASLASMVAAGSVQLRVIEDELAASLPAGITVVGPPNGDTARVWIDEMRDVTVDGSNYHEIAIRRARDAGEAAGSLALFTATWAMAQPLTATEHFNPYMPAA